MTENNPPEPNPRAFLLKPVFLAYVLVVAVMGYRVWMAPAWGWDVLAYAGCVAEAEGLPGGEIHRRAYSELTRNAPAEVARELTGGEVTRQGQKVYREKLSKDPAAFNAQLNFYRGRQLYIRLLGGLEALGIPSMRGIFLVSVLAGMGLALLLALWLSHYLPPSLAILGALAGLALSDVASVAASGSPDMLAAVLLLTGGYFLLETKRRALALTFFLAALATRADHILWVAPLLLAVALPGLSNRPKLGARPLAIALVACFAMVLWCTAGQNTYPWWTVVHHTFVEYMAFPQQQTPAPDYAAALSRAARSLPMFRAVEPLAFSLAAFAGVVWGWRQGRFASLGLRIGLASLAGAMAHFALFPALWPRLMVPYWLLGLIGLCAAWAEHNRNQSKSDQASP